MKIAISNPDFAFETDLQVSQRRWPFLHWKILVGGAISSRHTWSKMSKRFSLVGNLLDTLE